ncbi:MAG TPA: DUF433 domain-containing protein [Tepidisphaeraceae bacterium]|jgi:uncharacterized protein (DUF433 family)|nr:DUF433 domain-containing protein [Tepidisphaeraceae bacterium]
MSDVSPLTVDPDIQAGTPCFTGTRVPVKSLFDAIDHGRSLDEFLRQFPSVTPAQARAVLGQARTLIERSAKGASAA